MHFIIMKGNFFKSSYSISSASWHFNLYGSLSLRVYLYLFVLQILYDCAYTVVPKGNKYQPTLYEKQNHLRQVHTISAKHIQTETGGKNQVT